MSVSTEHRRRAGESESQRKAKGRHQAAIHEAGHAVAGILSTRALFGNDYGFSRIRLNDTDAPLEDDRGRQVMCSGLCDGTLRHTPITVLAPNINVRDFYRQIPGWDHLFRPRIEWQIVIDVSGGAAVVADLSELRGRRIGRDAFRAACIFGDRGNYDDMVSASNSLEELRKLTGRKYGLNRFIDRARALVERNLRAIRTLATELERVGDLYFDDAYPIVSPLIN